MDQDQIYRRTKPPPELKEKVEAFVRSQALVKKFTKRLQKAQKECDRLEKELAVYLDATAIVHACPPEVLSVIFRFYLKENPRFSRRLLLVCRSWYNALINEPTLWTQISTRLIDDPNLENQTSLESSYITACIQRSGSCLLDVQPDLSALCTTSTYAKRHLNDFINDLFSGAEPQVWEDLGYWAGELDLEDFNAMGMNTVSCSNHALKLITLLVGNQGEHMERWSSFHLTLPAFDEELAVGVWQLFIGNTPNLTEMSVDKAGAAYDKLRTQFHRGFPNLSAVRYLIAGPVPDLDFLTLGADSLEKLVVVTNIGKSGCLELNRFQQLKILTIISPPFNSDPWDSERSSPTTHLSLPHLERLTLNGCFMSIESINFDLPALKAIHFDTSQLDPTFIAHKLPNINAPTVWWEFYTEDESLQHSLNVLLTFLLLHFKQSSTLYTHSSTSKALITIIRELDLQGNWPGNWKFIEAGNNEVWVAPDSSRYWSDSDWVDTEFTESD